MEDADKWFDDDLRDERTVKGALLQALLRYSHSPFAANIVGSLVGSQKAHPGELSIGIICNRLEDT